MKKFLNIIFAGVFLFFVAAPVTAVAVPTQASAGPSCEGRFLGIPPWYRGLTNDACGIKSPNDVGGISNFIWIIVLNGIEMALVLTAYIALFFILYGGFLLITAAGNPSTIQNGQKSILNAVIGLIIAMASIAITNFVFGIFGSATTNQNGIVQMSGEELLHNILNIVYFAAGTAAVVVIIIAGIFYITSAGDAGKVTRAKNTILYSIVGLIVVLVAFVITNFVIGSFS